jgi:hypothetical protein
MLRYKKHIVLRKVSYAATINYKNAKDSNYGILTIFYA